MCRVAKTSNKHTMKREKSKAKEEDKSSKLKQQVKELEDNWKRALADYQNLEKRVALEKQEFAKWANSNLILKLLPILDTLKKAEKQLKDQGLSLTVKQFWGILENEGLTKIEVLGREFNPEEMECVEVTEGNQENVVAQEINPGYRFKDKVLQVAKVKVFKKPVDKKR